MASRIRNALKKTATAVVELRIQTRGLPGRPDVLIGNDVIGLGDVEFGGDNLVGPRTSFSGSVEVGRCTTIGCDSRLNGPLTIGSYCQLAPSVGVYTADHPVHHVTTYVNARLFDGRLKANVTEQGVAIGHDVWIGHGAVLLKGVDISTGAIIGAGAVVTGSVAPYAIVVGVPARVVGSRFDDDVIELMLRSRWWERTPAELEPYAELFLTDLSTQRDGGRAALKELIAVTERARNDAQSVS